MTVPPIRAPTEAEPCNDAKCRHKGNTTKIINNTLKIKIYVIL